MKIEEVNPLATFRSDEISPDSDESDNEPISKKKKDASGSEDDVKEEPASDKEEPASDSD